MKKYFPNAATVFVLLFCCSFAHSSDSLVNEKQSLREYTLGTAGRQAYGLYFQNQKAGWMVYESRLETRGSGDSKKEFALSRIEMHIQLGRGAEQIKIGMAQFGLYSLSGDGALAYAEETESENNNSTKHTARPVPNNPKQLLIISQRNRRETARRRATTRDTLSAGRKFHLWLLGKPAKNAKFQLHTFDVGDGRDTPTEMAYQDVKTISWGGVPTEIFTVNMKSQGMNSMMEVRSNGWPIRARFAGMFDLRAEDETLAKKLDGKGVDMLAASLIKTNRHVDNSLAATELRVELSGLGEFQMPSTARQEIVSTKDATAVLRIRREAAINPTSLTADQRAEFLKASNVYPQTTPIKNLAKSIVKNETDPVKKAGLLQSWVYRNLRKTMAVNAETAGEVLRNRAGDCTEHSLLFIALARASGIPSRQVGGIMYAGSPFAPIFGWHAWAQIHDGRGWVSIDPTWNQVRVDATHVEFSFGDEDWAWINVLGTLQIKILDVQSR